MPACSSRAGRGGWDVRGSARVAQALAWCGPVAAALDLAQNVALALILAGHHTQPWPLVSADTAIITRGLAEGVLVFAIIAGVSTLIGRPRPAET